MYQSLEIFPALYTVASVGISCLYYYLWGFWPLWTPFSTSCSLTYSTLFVSQLSPWQLQGPPVWPPAPRLDHRQLPGLPEVSCVPRLPCSGLCPARFCKPVGVRPVSHCQTLTVPPTTCHTFFSTLLCFANWQTIFLSLPVAPTPPLGTHFVARWWQHKIWKYPQPDPWLSTELKFILRGRLKTKLLKLKNVRHSNLQRTLKRHSRWEL